ncbi:MULTISPECIES: hypothetical protein [unclassified Legionella]|uniref:hypothetical protein n=1 Tax=unclassified Legionella TaxID=2622702 RepID=UPI001054A404|nr:MULTISPECIES: hypothetical protein [unclassified Legionella]MDI9818552.1 hypothetical protein [Legionella sp. PL877]
MAHENITTPEHQLPPHQHHHCTVHPFKRISWTAIFMGALVGLGLGFLLNLFGLAIGLSAFTLDNQGAMILAIGGMIGIIIGIIVSMVVAGYTAGYLGRLYCPKRNLGILYGFTTWSVALILSAVAAGHFSHYVAAYSSPVSNPIIITMDPAQPAQVGTEGTAGIANAPPIRANVPADNLAWSAFIVFILFFIGAVSACVGAHWGMSCRRDD